MTSQDVVSRNRKNAKLSTGPRTQEGKLASRRNALKHGLTASPAALGVEQAKLFDVLHEQLCDELQPRNQLERSIVHRMAVASWRLNRAALIDSAVSTRRSERIRTPRHEINNYIKEFHGCFVWKEVQEQDVRLLAAATAAGFVARGDRWMRVKRTGLQFLEGLRQEMMGCESGLRAMLVLLEGLWRKYRDLSSDMPDGSMHKLAWLLGDDAGTIPVNFTETPFGGGRVLKEIGEFSTPVGIKYELLRDGWGRVENGIAPPTVKSAVDAALETLTNQFYAVANQQEWEHEERSRQIALLPDSKTLDRQQRYETAAERSLYRAIDQFSKLRGITIERITASLSGVHADGSRVDLRDERVTIRRPASESCGSEHR